MSDWPITLRAEDAASPPDPQAATAEHRDAIRALYEETRHLVRLLTRRGEDPAATLSRALHMAVDIDRRADLLDRSAEALALAHRAAGTYSATFAIREGRP